MFVSFAICVSLSYFLPLCSDPWPVVLDRVGHFDILFLAAPPPLQGRREKLLWLFLMQVSHIGPAPLHCPYLPGEVFF